MAMKQSIIVPAWLGMSPGKVASQCCHVASKYGRFEDYRVVLKVATEAQLLEIIAEALTRGLIITYFRDSNPTTEGTDGVITAWSIRGPEQTVNEVTGKMELY